MKKLLTTLACLFLCFGALAPASFAQIELFGGYSYLRLRTVTGTGQNANGWEATLSAHLLGPLGVEADYSNHYGISPANTGVEAGFTELYGPRFQLFSLPRIEPYVHALFGTAHGVGIVPSGCAELAAPCPVETTSQNAFAMAFGGGLNVKATHHVWIRVIQVDYLRSDFSFKAQNSPRISAGLVLRFGKW